MHLGETKNEDKDKTMQDSFQYLEESPTADMEVFFGVIWRVLKCQNIEMPTPLSHRISNCRNDLEMPISPKFQHFVPTTTSVDSVSFWMGLAFRCFGIQVPTFSRSKV